MNKNKIIGQKGENQAISYLKKKGYKILDKNFHSRFGEIDIVALQEDTICFIEVKNYSGNNLLNINYSIPKSKQKKIIKTARYYILKNNTTDTPCRFDAIFIYNGQIEHFEAAFNLN